jgi:hypothetical protein
MLRVVAVVRLGRAPVVVEHLRAVAADPKDDALFAARSALRRAYTLRDGAQVQIDQLRGLVERLQAERRAGT